MTARFYILTLTTLLIFSTIPASAKDPLKVGTVDMQELFKKYHRTTSVQQSLNIERAKIQQSNNERLTGIKKLEGELQGLRKDLDNPAISDKKKQELFKQFQVKTQEGVAMDKERREFLERRNGALNGKMVEQMKGILVEIREKVQKRGKSGGYDCVVDMSGLSTSQVPFMIYSNLEDLTADLLAELNKNAPGGEKPGAKPAP